MTRWRSRRSTSGAWTWRAMAAGRPWPTPTPRCARTTRGASASASRTRSCRRARPLRTTPVYDRLQAENAVFGVGYGLEHALWFAPDGSRPNEDVTYRRSNALDAVAARVPGGARGGRPDGDLRPIAEYDVEGPDAEAWLDAHARQPHAAARPRGAARRCSTSEGKLIGDFTVGQLAAEPASSSSASSIAETYHLRWFERQRCRLGRRVRSLFAPS